MGNMGSFGSRSDPTEIPSDRLTPSSGRALDLQGFRQRLGELREKRSNLEEQLFDEMPLLRGSLVSQFKTCGKKNCHCQDGKKHGPFTYLSMHVDGRTKTLFVRELDRLKAQELVGNYRVFRQIKAELFQLNREISQLLEGVETVRLRRSEAFFPLDPRPKRRPVGSAEQLKAL